MIDKQLQSDLERDEGRKLSAYRDSAGYWTIGVGHLLGTSPRMSSITDRECDALLAQDIADAIAMSIEVIPKFNQLSPARQRAVINMSFNRGGHMRMSKSIVPNINAAIDNNNWSAVADAIKVSPWAVQVGARATRLAAALEKGGL